MARFLICSLLMVPWVYPANAEMQFIEAEQFDHFGGWVNDCQFMDQMGSPFLLAHGLGRPVADATTTVKFHNEGEYHVWVRTRDWVAPWNAPGAPGKFQLLINGKPLGVTFGTEGAEWHWQDGGMAKINGETAELALHDLTGFEGRCDAILFASDTGFIPANNGFELYSLRRAPSKSPDAPIEAGEFDLVVTGGGISGTCAAIAAARLGLTVALIQDRPVLGGNNSSEVRVWLNGARNKAPFPRVGDIVWELEQTNRAHYGPENTAEIYEDGKKIALAENEENLTLFLDHRANAVEMGEERIQAIIAQDTRTGMRKRFAGKWFVDATGDGCVGFLAGADYDLTPTGHMGRCNLWNVIDTGEPAPFPNCPWALDLTDKPFPGRDTALTANTGKRGIDALGGWYWESGFDHDPFEKNEYIRDWNFRAMYGAWDALKNVDGKYPNHALNWAAYVSGKRESRRLLGDIVLTQEDVLKGKAYPDGCVPTGWPIDLHLPDPRYVEGFEGDAFISKAYYARYEPPYWIPYRCLYSRNIANLFMAGRDISVTHEALGTVRVMRTGGCMGEVVGMAALVCKQENTDPRGVYEKHLEELHVLMRRGVGKPPPPRATPKSPPWLPQAGANLARSAQITVSSSLDPKEYPVENINDGQYDINDNSARWVSGKKTPATVELTWDEPQIFNAIRIISGQTGKGSPETPIINFAVQYHWGKRWREIPGGRATANSSYDWSVKFDPVTAAKVRLVVNVTPDDLTRLWEFEVFNVAGAD